MEAVGWEREKKNCRILATVSRLKNDYFSTLATTVLLGRLFSTAKLKTAADFVVVAVAVVGCYYILDRWVVVGSLYTVAGNVDFAVEVDIGSGALKCCHFVAAAWVGLTKKMHAFEFEIDFEIE